MHDINNTQHAELPGKWLISEIKKPRCYTNMLQRGWLLTIKLTWYRSQ